MTKWYMLCSFGILVALCLLGICVYDTMNQAYYQPALTPVDSITWSFGEPTPGREVHEHGWIIQMPDGSLHIFYDKLEMLIFIGAVTEY